MWIWKPQQRRGVVIRWFSGESEILPIMKTPQNNKVRMCIYELQQVAFANRTSCLLKICMHWKFSYLLLEIYTNKSISHNPN